MQEKIHLLILRNIMLAGYINKLWNINLCSFIALDEDHECSYCIVLEYWNRSP